MYSQANPQISAKELSYLSDSLKNEETLLKLCLQGVVESQNPQLKQTFANLAQERFGNFDQLFRLLQQHA